MFYISAWIVRKKRRLNARCQGSACDSFNATCIMRCTAYEHGQPQVCSQLKYNRPFPIVGAFSSDNLCDAIPNIQPSISPSTENVYWFPVKEFSFTKYLRAIHQWSLARLRLVRARKRNDRLWLDIVLVDEPAREPTNHQDRCENQLQLCRPWHGYSLRTCCQPVAELLSGTGRSWSTCWSWGRLGYYRS